MSNESKPQTARDKHRSAEGLWLGKVDLVPSKKSSNVYTIDHRCERAEGLYDHTDVATMIAKIIKAKVNFDGWKIWADPKEGFSVKPEAGAPVTPKQLATLAKEAAEIQLVYVQRPWPQPKFRFFKNKPVAGEAKVAKAEEPLIRL